MAYLIKILDEQGNFELIDEALLDLYPTINRAELVALSDEQYQQFCEQNTGASRFIKGEFVFERTLFDEIAFVSQTQQSLIRRIADKTDRLKADVLVGYPQAEIDSFYRQEAEARAWQADNTADTSMLSAIATARGVPLAILAVKVIEKADAVSVIMGKLIGKRQQFEDRILASTTLEQLTALEQEIEQWTLAD